jgi:hypothetical protein
MDRPASCPGVYDPKEPTCAGCFQKAECQDIMMAEHLKFRLKEDRIADQLKPGQLKNQEVFDQFYELFRWFRAELVKKESEVGYTIPKGNVVSLFKLYMHVGFAFLPDPEPGWDQFQTEA